jgi:hypothetical protein
VQQRKERPNPPQTTKKVPFQKHKNKITKRVRIVIQMKLEFVIYSKYTTAEGVATERERESTYFVSYLSPPPYSISTRPD